MSPLQREPVTTATRKEFTGQAFDWGARDCLIVARYHLIGAGYTGLPKIPAYKDAKTALKALKKAGYASVSDIFDSLLEPILPAQMLLGDIATMKGEGGMDAVVIGNVRFVWGYAEGNLEKGLVPIDPLYIEKAWRV